MFEMDIARLLRNFNNIGNRIQNILLMLPYFNSIVCNILKLFRCYAGSYLLFLIIR